MRETGLEPVRFSAAELETASLTTRTLTRIRGHPLLRNSIVPRKEMDLPRLERGFWESESHVLANYTISPKLAVPVGFEPTTLRLTATRSTD